jgi:uncharacterized MAPEG superfamily protein
MTYELWVLALNAVILLVLYGMQGTDTVLNAPKWGLGARDEARAGAVFTGRARRTVRNQIEAVAVFTPLALIAYLLKLSEHTLVIWGAGLFLGARVFYVPCYLLGVPYLRTLVWGAGFAGSAMIAYAVLTAS